MTAQTILLETAASAIRVLSRRKLVFSDPNGYRKLEEHNKKLNSKMYGVFSDNKYYNQETTAHVPSPNRKTFLRKVQRAEAVNAAIEILGRGSDELKTFSQVIDETMPWLVLSQDMLTKIDAGFDPVHFKNFSNASNNLKVFDAMIKRNQKPNETQYAYIQKNITAARESAAELLGVLRDPVVSQLTNFPRAKKRVLHRRLEEISTPKTLGKIGELQKFIQSVNGVHLMLGNIFDNQLLRPIGIALTTPRHTTNRSELPSSGGLGRIIKRVIKKTGQIQQSGQLSLF